MFRLNLVGDGARMASQQNCNIGTKSKKAHCTRACCPGVIVGPRKHTFGNSTTSGAANTVKFFGEAQFAFAFTHLRLHHDTVTATTITTAAITFFRSTHRHIINIDIIRRMDLDISMI